MKIVRVRVRRYRCLRDLEIDLDDYTVLVGPNGSGKSSLLYALDWFFNGGEMTDDDHYTVSGVPDPIDEIDVEVTFDELSDEDRRVLGQYGRGDTVWFRKIWSKETGKDKMFGNARQGPGFAGIRATTRITETRTLYEAVRQSCSTLNEVTTSAAAEARAEIFANLESWEDDPVNRDSLEEIEDSDASHMFGFNGEYVLARRVRFLLVPASTDIASEVMTSGKSNAVSQLIGALMADAVSTARVKWETDHADELAALATAIKDGVEKSTKLQESRVNSLLESLVPNASIAFVAEIPPWSGKSIPVIQTDVTIDGESKDVSRQGHGIQRAVLISMLQTVVPDEATAKAEAGDGDDAEEQFQEALKKLPALVVSIEEPEIYQHPVRARHFAKVLSQWADRPGSQVVLATHSPYFVLPEQFSSLRRFKLEEGCSSSSSTTVSAVAAAAGLDDAKVKRMVAREVPRTFSEGFFADAVVLVEGETDRAAIEVLGERLGESLDANGTAILVMGGGATMKIPYFLLHLIGIPVYLVADADFLGAARKSPEKQAEAAVSHENATTNLLGWLPSATKALCGALPFSWGDSTTVTENWTIMHDDLETELEAWPELLTQMTAQHAALRSKDALALRSAVSDADLTGLPETLRHLIEAIAMVGQN